MDDTDEISKFAREATIRTIQKIGQMDLFLENPAVSIIKTSTKDYYSNYIETTYTFKIPSAGLNNFNLLKVSEQEVKYFLRYSSNDTAKAKFMAYILGQHD